MVRGQINEENLRVSLEDPQGAKAGFITNFSTKANLATTPHHPMQNARARSVHQTPFLPLLPPFPGSPSRSPAAARLYATQKLTRGPRDGDGSAAPRGRISLPVGGCTAAPAGADPPDLHRLPRGARHVRPHPRAQRQVRGCPLDFLGARVIDPWDS